MKKIVSLIVVAVATLTVSFVHADEYGANDYTGTTGTTAWTAESTAAAAPTAAENASDDATDGDVKCFWGRRYCCWNYYYYTPCVYYYRPCTYYYRYTYSPVYYYRYRYITFYKSADVKSATNEGGIIINENPQSGTPLAAQKVVKGDVITQINGKSVTDPRQIDEITAESKLVVLKFNDGTNPSEAIAPGVPAAEYGSFEY